MEYIPQWVVETKVRLDPWVTEYVKKPTPRFVLWETVGSRRQIWATVKVDKGWLQVNTAYGLALIEPSGSKTPVDIARWFHDTLRRLDRRFGNEDARAALAGTSP